MSRDLWDSFRITLADNRQPTRDAVRWAMLQLIANGVIRTDETVNLAAAARRLGVSVTPVREALIQLEQDDIVVSAPGRGFVVRRLRKRDAEDLYRVIWTLECLAVDCLRAPFEDLVRQLTEANEAFIGAANMGEAFGLDSRWHDVLTSESANPVLIETLRRLRRRTWRYESRYMADAERRATSGTEHQRIQQALLAGDREEAKRILRANWGSVTLIFDQD